MKRLLSCSGSEIVNTDCERSSIFGLRLFLLTLVLLFTFAAPVLADDDDDDKGNKKPVISYSVVNDDKTVIDIIGENLRNKGDPIVILGLNGKKGTSIDIPLTVILSSPDGKLVTAGIPDGVVVEDGTHLLTVKTKKGTAEFHAVVGALGGGGTTGPAVAYTRWGRSDCPAGAELVYQGVVAGSPFNIQGGSNLLCLTLTPVNGPLPTNIAGYDSLIAPAIYQNKNSPIPEITALKGSVAPCAVCRKSNTAIAIMHPGSDVCPSTFTREYPGYLMSSSANFTTQSEYICVDQSPQAVSGSATVPFGVPSILYNTRFFCQTTGECPPYEQSSGVTCSMCSR